MMHNIVHHNFLYIIFDIMNNVVLMLYQNLKFYT